jgi:hypothetical protein
MALPHHPEPQWFLRQLSWNDVHAYREKHFLNDPIVKWLGEKSTSYLERPETAKYIKSTLPESKIFAILRNPVERALSNYHYSVMNGFETRSLSDALEGTGATPSWRESDVSVSPFAYLERGMYSRLLLPWRDVFGDALHVLMFEDVVRGVADRYIRSFLDLPYYATDRSSVRVNGAPRNGPEPSAALIQRLYEIFEAPNRELAAAFGVDVSHWCREA